ncbi:MOSC domain-containing protein [Streptomyces sp. MBT65]|uniref:MOSC domain-containing protein n=1 Tax=Streptomyces sp. MBT65 TaxID=1488395 RepID=UPI00190CC318|nr:MOSC domain-containing protein [Streptomyces sp. MBT65]MBK3573896.1 MOSC domain-containing protein [Streptomyces sp. MBT65]
MDGLRFDRLLGLANDVIPLESFGNWTSYEAFHALDTRPDLGGYSARIVADTGTEGAEVVLTARDGEELRLRLREDGRLDDDEFVVSRIQHWFGTPGRTARLASSGSHLWDFADAPISIINLATVRDIARVAKTPLDPRRFRANLYVDGLPPWAEFGLLGAGLRIGEVDLDVLRPIERCRATAVDPATGGTEVNVPGILAGHFGHRYCGVYAQVATPGLLQVGEHVHVGVRRPLTYAGQKMSRTEIASAPRMARVTSVSRAAATATSIEFEDPSPAFATARPGQYLRVHRLGVDAPGWRNYTISRAGDGPARITAEYRDGGVVSPWLSRLQQGEHVLVTGPFGDAVIDADEDRPLLVLTAGIGITPALAMAHALVAGSSDRPVDFVHVVRDYESLPHRDELQSAIAQLSRARLHLHVTRPQPENGAVEHRRGRPDGAFITSILAEAVSTEVHLCGPASFVREMREIVQAAGVPATSIRYDAFYSPRPVDVTPRPAPHAGPFQVTYRPSGAMAEWSPASGTLLDLAESQGLTLRADCRAGVCGTCASTVHGRTAYLVDPLVEPRDGTVLLCSSVPTTDLVIDES